MYSENGNKLKIRLIEEDANKLLVAMYAWDENALPGNGYLNSLFTASKNTSTACRSAIVKLENPEINAYLVTKLLLKY